MRVFITGITGFLGSGLEGAFRERGWTCAGTTHSTPHSSQHVRYRLGDRFDPHVLNGCDLVIHAAHDFTRGSLERNLDGTLNICESAIASGVGRQIYLSSYSARADSLSEYGRTKKAVEAALLSRGVVIVRPGLVIGNGGLFARNLRFLMKSPGVPLVAGERNLIPVIAIQDFLKAMATIAEAAPERAEWNLFNPALVSMRALVRATAQAAGRRTLILDVPAGLALVALRAARALGLKLPVDVNNLKALMSNQNVQLESHLLELVPEPSSLDEMMREAVRLFRLSKSGS